MNPKVGITLTGLALSMAATAQLVANTTDNGFDHGRIGGPFTNIPHPETTKSIQDQGFGPNGRVGGPYNHTEHRNSTSPAFGPNGRVGGPFNNTANATASHGFGTGIPSATPLTTVTVWAKGTHPTETAVANDDFECGIHELTTTHVGHLTPVPAPTQKDITDVSKQISKVMEEIWSNATETVMFSINPITPTGPPPTPIPGTSPIYSTLMPGSINWNGTDSEVSMPPGTGATGASVEATHTPLPKHHDDSFENGSGQVGLSAAAIVAALAAYGL